MSQGEIVWYQDTDKKTTLEVRLDEETVWLTQAQMVELFDSSKQNVSLHINNIFNWALFNMPPRTRCLYEK